MKIFFMLFVFPIATKAQYVNLLNNKSEFKGSTIKFVIAEQDSLVFTGHKYVFDTSINEYTNQFFIGKLSNDTKNESRVVNIFEKKYHTTKAVKMFKKPFGYSIIFSFFGKKDSLNGECGYIINSYTKNLELINTNQFLFIESNISDTTGKYGATELFSEVFINSQNNYVLTVLYKKKWFSSGSYELGNTILELDERAKPIKNKVIEFDNKASWLSNTVSLSPIVTLEEINLNDSIKYIGFNGYNLGGHVYLDSLYNIRKVNNFLMSLPIKASEYRFQYAFIKSVKRNNTIYVGGVGDSIAKEGQNAEDYIPSIIIKKIVNNQTVRTLCIQNIIDYSLYDEANFNGISQNNFLNLNEKGEIIISMIVSVRYTYLALLDSNLNLIWEKYIERNSPWATGIIGATTAFDNNGFYFYGHYCINCTINSTASDISGVIGYISNNGNLLGIKEGTTLKDEKIKVFPNPATAFLNIEAEAPINEISIFNLEGKEVFKLKSRDITKKINLNMEENNIIKGLYIIHVVTENETFFKKLIVDN